MAFDKKRHLQQNIDAIRTVFNLEKEGRSASNEEKLLLKNYSGFWGLKFILNPITSLNDIRK
ncbi:hypothetical protein [Sphingobacterium siyangense]|uniref:hypothetical protein n=1 Tax=Sphingobacterium siyangense TaxID=459529 RepID=UPI00196540F2|nr:hypothetical protein [Sphingobacterium siyangense]QRY55894.1 hypothetical protein JVX97_17905 [Sphingobacterium siyangense]